MFNRQSDNSYWNCRWCCNIHCGCCTWYSADLPGFVCLQVSSLQRLTLSCKRTQTVTTPNSGVSGCTTEVCKHRYHCYNTEFSLWPWQKSYYRHKKSTWRCWGDWSGWEYCLYMRIRSYPAWWLCYIMITLNCKHKFVVVYWIKFWEYSICLLLTIYISLGVCKFGKNISDFSKFIMYRCIMLGNCKRFILLLIKQGFPLSINFRIYLLKYSSPKTGILCTGTSTIKLSY